MYYRLNRVSAHPSTIMSWVAAREFTQKNTDVSMVIWGVSSTNQSLIFDPMKKYDSPVPWKIYIAWMFRENPYRYHVIQSFIHLPIRISTGISHDFRLPILREYAASTIGAHNSFRLYGKSTALNFACVIMGVKKLNKSDDKLSEHAHRCSCARLVRN